MAGPSGSAAAMSRAPSARAGALTWSRWVLTTVYAVSSARSRTRSVVAVRGKADPHESVPGTSGRSESQVVRLASSSRRDVS